MNEKCRDCGHAMEWKSEYWVGDKKHECQRLHGIGGRDCKDNQLTAAREENDTLRERVKELEKGGIRLYRCPECGVADTARETVVYDPTGLDDEADRCGNCLGADIGSGMFIPDALATPPGRKEGG
ncbi:hypothetical protein LCGC14_0234890 [marine sediment metagenome]|uniref:Uncharacterized protein n=1 Tax=marine sediment metagenome TaxID=412755 RepID=A0A0F9XD00_9ZZZZ